MWNACSTFCVTVNSEQVEHPLHSWWRVEQPPMNVVLWILQIVLAAMFLMAGVGKATQPKEKLVPRLPWAEDYSASTVRFIGIAELLGAIGLVVPAVTGILPVLTPAAATGLAVLMALAMNTHRRRREPGAIAFTAVLFAVAVVIAWGRFGPYAL
jgi:uncharacterized membrane protein